MKTEAGRFTDIAPVGGGFGGVLWGSAGITVPWEAYQQYGDSRLLEEHYEAMAAYIDYLDTTLGDEGLSSDNALGDWLGPQNNQLGSDFLVTAYHVYDLGIMARTAELAVGRWLPLAMTAGVLVASWSWGTLGMAVAAVAAPVVAIASAAAASPPGSCCWS